MSELEDDIAAQLEREDQERIRHEALWLARGLPEALLKASADKPFEYAVGLVCGTVIYFEGVELPPPGEFHGWIHLTKVLGHNAGRILNPYMGGGLNPFNFDRGMDVHLSQIAWAADAPFGS